MRGFVLLRDLDFPTTIDSSTHDLMGDFFVPALKAAVRYERGVGFFSSGWLRVAAEDTGQVLARPPAADYNRMHPGEHS